MSYEIGQKVGKLILIVFFIIVLVLLDLKNKKRFPLIILFVLGWFLYVIPMELRPFFRENHLVLFWFGIIPNYGCAFALPIIGLKKKSITYNEARYILLKSSIISFSVIILYELVESIKGFGTFDWLDIFMSILGTLTINIIFNLWGSRFRPIFS